MHLPWLNAGLLVVLLPLVLSDNGLPNPIQSCGKLEAVVSTVVYPYEISPRPAGYPENIYKTPDDVMPILSYNPNDLSDPEHPAAGSGIQFAWPYLRSLSCMDGRQTGLVLGAPGAEAGVFIIALFQYFQQKGLLITNDTIPQLLSEYFQAIDKNDVSNTLIVDRGRFLTVHTDETALRALLTAINAKVPDKFPDVFDPLSLTADQQAAFVSALSVAHPEYFGCAHLTRLVTTYDFPFKPQSFVVEALKGVFKFMFLHANDSKDSILANRIQLQILHGGHAERAVVWMESSITDDPCRFSAGPSKDYTFRTSDTLPMLNPRVLRKDGSVLSSVLVVHDQAVDFRLEEWSRFLTYIASKEALNKDVTKPPVFYSSVPSPFNAKDFARDALAGMRMLWGYVKNSAFSGCTADNEICFNYLPQYKISYKRVYDPEYQTIASVVMIVCALTLWFLLWRLHSLLEKGETLMPNVKMVDKLFTKKGALGAYFDNEPAPPAVAADQSNAAAASAVAPAVASPATAAV